MIGQPVVPPERAGEPDVAAPGGPSSLLAIAAKQFLKHPLAKGASAVLGVLYLVCAFADLLAPYPERTIDPRRAFQPPQWVYFVHEGSLVHPYVYAMTRELDLTTFETVWRKDRSVRYPLAFGEHRTGRADRYVPFPVSLVPEPLRQAIGLRPWATWRAFAVAGVLEVPRSADVPRGADVPHVTDVRVHLWGTDDLGGDVFGKVLYGGRISLTIGILAALVTVALGMSMGGLAGYYGGWVDEVILRLVEALSAIPPLFLLLALSAVSYPLNLPSSIVFPLIVVALSLVGWGGVARTVPSN